MYKSTFATLAFCGIASATNTTTSLWLFGLYSNDTSIVASIIGSDATATTYSLDCVDKASCNLPTSFTYTQGPSTAHYANVNAQASGLTETFEIGCAITSSASGVCSITMNIDAAATTLSTTTTSSFSNASEIGMAITITAGPSQTSAAFAVVDAAIVTAPYSSIATHVSGGSYLTSATSSLSSSSTISSMAKAATGSPISSQGGGSPMVTQAPWVVGMAAGIALAAL